MTLSNEKAARLIKAGRDLEKLLAASEALNTFLEISEELEENEGPKIPPIQISGDFVEGLPDDFIATSENIIAVDILLYEVKKGIDDLSKGLLNSFHAEEGGPVFKPVTLKAKGLKMAGTAGPFFIPKTGNPTPLQIQALRDAYAKEDEERQERYQAHKKGFEEGGTIFKPVTLKAKGLKMKWDLEGHTGYPAPLLIDEEMQRKAFERAKKMDEEILNFLSGIETDD
jgi:hypothetical protein